MFKMISWVLMVAVLVAGAASAEAAKGKNKGKKTPEQRFHRLDANKDGKLAPEELSSKVPAEKKDAAAKRFKRLDTNNDGFLELAEFKAGGKSKK